MVQVIAVFQGVVGSSQSSGMVLRVAPSLHLCFHRFYSLFNVSLLIILMSDVNLLIILMSDVGLLII